MMDIEKTRRQKRKNVQEQNAVQKDNIRICAERFEKNSEEFAWLEQVLLEHEVPAGRGIMCSLKDIPDQSGLLWEGLWLTDAQRFFAFSVLRAYDGAVVETEEWKEVTEDICVSGHVQGTGKSLAFLALEVIDECRAG